jgi:Rho GTPase-activating protein 1
MVCVPCPLDRQSTNDLVSTLTGLATLLPIEDLLIPTSAYLHDRRLSAEVLSPRVSGRRAFSASQPYPKSRDGQLRTPRVLREATKFVLMEENVVTEGIFRIPPHSKTLEILREAYDRGQKFIIWREGEVILPQRYHRFAEGFIEEIDLRDGYGIHLAAGIVKLWYRELREPLIPQTAYSELENVFGNEKAGVSPERLIDLLSIDSQWSSLPINSRLVLNTHLLPLLSLVEARDAQNKMTASNLAVCFAPTLICGPDPMQDIKVGAILRRVLQVAIEQWDKGLREICGFDAKRFEQSLLDPPEESDYEDPLLGERPQTPHKSYFGESTTQLDGIILEDKEIILGSEPAPPLPPRPIAAAPISRPLLRLDSEVSSLKRKPAPPLTVPPRYSMAIGNSHGVESESDIAPRYSVIMAQGAVASESPTTDAATTDGFNPFRAPSPERDIKTDSKKAEGVAESTRQAPTSRKALTSEQMTNVNNGLFPIIRKRNEDHHVDAHIKDSSEGESSAAGSRAILQTRQPPVVPPSAKSRSQSPEERSPALSGTQGTRKSSADTFVKPNWPASARSASTPVRGSSQTSSSNTLNIFNLAKPILPILESRPGRAVDRSPTIPTPVFAHTRAPSPGLSKRYRPTNHLQRAQSDSFSRPVRPPQRLKLGAGSVEDLRRIYEDRLGAVGGLAQAGQQKDQPGI